MGKGIPKRRGEGLKEKPRTGRLAFLTAEQQTQLAKFNKNKAQSNAKLTRQGLDRHEAILAIGAIISEDIFDVIFS